MLHLSSTLTSCNINIIVAVLYTSYTPAAILISLQLYQLHSSCNISIIAAVLYTSYTPAAILSTLSRLQSQYEPAVSTFKGSISGNATKALQRVMEEARPLVGIRDRGNEEWYMYNNYPLLSAYLEREGE